MARRHMCRRAYDLKSFQFRQAVLALLQDDIHAKGL